LFAFGRNRADYRKLPQALSKVYFHPLNEEVRLEMSKLFTSQTSPTSPLTTSSPTSSSNANPDPVIDSRELSVWGRKIFVPQSTSKVARFPFEKLCGEPLSSADYLEITGRFEVIFVEDMPELGIDRKDAVSRGGSSTGDAGRILWLRDGSREIWDRLDGSSRSSTVRHSIPLLDYPHRKRPR
jgi:predicted ATPase